MREKRNLKCHKLVNRIESSLVCEKPWYLKGDITSRMRPLNSLLQTNLDYDRNFLSTSSVSGKKSKTLEDIIKNRITEKKFDEHVEPRQKRSDSRTVKNLPLNCNYINTKCSNTVAPKNTKLAIKRAVKSLYLELIHKMYKLNSK